MIGRFVARAAIPSACALGLAGCATVPPSDAPIQDREAGATGGTCDGEPAQRYLGQTASADSGAAILRSTGAGIFQWVPPDSAVTMDFRADRVRVTYDRAMAITRVDCG